jgi:tetratricopeptide (TPR) repeat protein
MLHRHGLCVALLTVSALFLFSLPANSQHAAGGGVSTGTGAGSRTSPTYPNTTSGTNTTPDVGGRGLYLSGKVQMEDGAAPPEPVLIERVCGSGYRKAEGYTDSKGRFSFQLGQEQGVTEDATFETVAGGPGGSNGSSSTPPNRINSSGASSATTTSSRRLIGCDLTAALAGFRSDSVNLDQRRRLDDPDVGTLILHRLSNVEGSTISITTLQAPKDARKAYDKAREALHKDKTEEAQKQFAKAVELYPQFAEAWYQLGGLQEKNHQPAEASKSYSQAIAADPKLISPYLPLARLALHDKNWQDVADTTGRLLKLDAIDFPEAYYYNAAANFRLKKLSDAESSGRETLKLDTAHRFPEAAHILGIILYHKNDYAGAAEQLRYYLQIAPNAPDVVQVRGQLAELEHLATASKASSEAPQQQ